MRTLLVLLLTLAISQGVFGQLPSDVFQAKACGKLQGTNECVLACPAPLLDDGVTLKTCLSTGTCTRREIQENGEYIYIYECTPANGSATPGQTYAHPDWASQKPTMVTTTTNAVLIDRYQRTCWTVISCRSRCVPDANGGQVCVPIASPTWDDVQSACAFFYAVLATEDDPNHPHDCPVSETAPPDGR